MKICAKCKLNKPSSEFSKNRRYKSGLQSYCKKCHSAWTIASQKTKEGKLAQKRRQFKHKYGIRLEDIPNKCQICGSTKTICVDHCHETGKIRGFLCGSCNRALGLLKENADNIEALARYIRGQK